MQKIGINCDGSRTELCSTNMALAVARWNSYHAGSWSARRTT